MTRPNVVVVGAGVFGAWTAHHLQDRGASVTLIDAFGPANTLASSGGESRVTRAAYGKDSIYSQMARDSLPAWQALSDTARLPIFIPAGVLFFFPEEQPYLADTVTAHRALGLPSELLDRREMARRFPMIDFSDIAAGIHEPGFGALMARRAVQTLVKQFVSSGGRYLQGRAEAPKTDGRMEFIRLADGRTVPADLFVFAAGPWLPTLFPDVIGKRIRPTRQEVFYFAPPAGDPAFLPGSMPVWADFNHGDMVYGFPDLEARGVKVAHDVHGPEIDPDSQDRRPSMEAMAFAADYVGRRFPRLKGAQLTGAEVCQYENSSNGDFLIDFHPSLPNLLLVGGGSGHGFKHGPEVGRYCAELLLDGRESEPRFTLATKSETHKRDIH